MNQQELADRLGVSQQTISKYENGEREPDHNTLTKISDWGIFKKMC
jgi:transcriptional regulator with XRE-family HTH domain